MAWIECHENIWEHHKILRLCEVLQKPDYAVVGHLLSLWHFALRNALETGDLKPWGDVAIERAARWDGASGVFVKAMRDVTLLDDSTVHAWDDFTLHYRLILERRDRLKDQIKKRVNRFREKRKRTCNAPVTLSNADTIPNHTIPNHTKPKTPPNPQRGNEAFTTFWQVYPRKVGKGAAEKVWPRAVNGIDLAVILAAVEAQKRSDQWQKDGGQFIPNPATWLNQRRWEDELPKNEDDAIRERVRQQNERTKSILAGAGKPG